MSAHSRALVADGDDMLACPYCSRRYVVAFGPECPGDPCPSDDCLAMHVESYASAYTGAQQSASVAVEESYAAAQACATDVAHG